MADEGRTNAGAADLKARLRNNVKRLREDRLLTKAELARQAGVSTLTIDRVESGMPCRMDTKRKIILALGMTVAEKDKVFVRSAADDQPRGDDGEGSDDLTNETSAAATTDMASDGRQD